MNKTNQARGFASSLARIVLPLLPLCLSVVSLRAQSLQITSPADGSVAYSGQTLNVTVTATGTFQLVALFVQDPLSSPQPLAAPPYQFAIQVPATIASGSYALAVSGVTSSGQIVDVEPISIDIERSDVPQKLTTQLSALYMAYPGEIGSLIVYGQFADGSTVDLTYSSLLTYSSDIPAVSTVDTNALVTAVGPGTANIVLTYSGLSIQVPVSVLGPAIVPSTFSMYVSETQQFVAQLNMPPDVDPTVTWSISPQLGSIDQTGLYSAPSSVAFWQGVTVTATSVADPTKSASAKVWIFPPVSVNVIPSNATMSAAQAQTFTARVGSGSTEVTLAATPSGVGTLQLSHGTDPNNPDLPISIATYFAPAPISTAQTVTLTATSVYDNGKAGSAQISLVPSVAMSVSPATVSLYAFQTQQFAAAVTYSPGGAVTWTLDPSVGTIDQTGLYTAPCSVISQQTVSVIATGPDLGVGTYSASATITLVPRISASITVPTGVSAAVASNSEIDLSWTGSTEPGGTTAGYNVYHNGVWVGSTVGTSYADLGLIAGTSYAYTVAAYDTSGIASAQSDPVNASTLSGIPPNLVAYFNFDEGAGTVLHDSSGNGNNGAITGATWSASGKYGGALVFDGATSYVAAPNNVDAGTAMTLEAWVNPAVALGAVAEEEPYYRWVSFGLYDFCCGYVGVVVTDDFRSQVDLQPPGNTPLTSNAWTHLALTYDGTAVRIFNNGVQVASQPQSGAIATGSQTLYIGGDAINGNDFAGMIDDLRIYSRALSQAEIQNDMAGPTVSA